MNGLFHLLGLLKDQWSGGDEIGRRQGRRLARLVRHAYDTVPYYRRTFLEAGLAPEDIRGVADLQRIPVTTKERLRDLPAEEKVSRLVDIASCVRVRTNGSTGVPLELFFTRGDGTMLGTCWVRAMAIHGARPWHRRLEITGPHNLDPDRRWYQRLGLWRLGGVSGFDDPRVWVEAWRRLKPDILYGYAGSLKLLADHVLQHGLEDVRPRLIFGVSEMVYDDYRRSIRKAFGVELVDLYGAAETGLIAWQCPRCDGYHLNWETVVVEYLQGSKPAPPGTAGRLVVTNLRSHAMPIIRYELGDVAVPSAEPSLCGRAAPRLKSIVGRSDAFLALPSGRLLSPLASDNIMKPVAGVREWRIFQKEIGRLKVCLVPGDGFNEGTVRTIRTRWEEHVREKLDLEIQLMESLPPDRSGKVRAVISEIKSDLSPP